MEIVVPYFTALAGWGKMTFVKRLIQTLFGIFLFTFPFSIRFLAYEEASYRFGNFNPWVSGFIYLPEVFLGIVFVLWVVQKLRVRNYELGINNVLWFLLFLFVITTYVVTFVQGDSFLGAMFVLRAFEALIVFWLITDKVLSAKQIITILLFGATLQILWGYAQWKLNHSLGLTFLGESVIGPEVLGVAKMDLADGAKQIRAYGSFLHPNILAGYLLAVFYLSLPYLKYAHKLFFFALFTWGIYLTQSRAAMLVGGVGLGLYFLFAFFKKMSFRKVIALIALLVLMIGNVWFFRNSAQVTVRDAAFQERLTQNVISQRLWQAHPFGVGVQNFTLEMENFADKKLRPWEFQPVHNTYFLILNEIGALGLAILIIVLVLVFYRYWRHGKAIPFLVLILLAPFDHFLWDSWIGFILMALVIGFFKLENHKEGAVEHLIHAVKQDGELI